MATLLTHHQHLQNVYLLLGDVPPPELDQPISRRGQRVTYTSPRSFLEVKIDGRYTFFEWLSAGHYACQNERGTMAMALHGPLKDVYFGFSLELLLIRIDCDEPARSALAAYDAVRLVFVEPPGREVRIDKPATPAQTVTWRQSGKAAAALPPGLAVGLEQILELAIPFDTLGVAVDEPIHFFVELVREDQGLDRAPREGTIGLARPSADFELIMWNV